jgi:sigma-B regulation protein RsbU (phosphoserine phosphatase)
MTNFLFFTYLAACAACLVLWYDAAKRPEYGKRPPLFLFSIIILAVAGLLLLVAKLGFRENVKYYLFPLLTMELLLDFIALFVLEYSVHMQRIRRSFLLDIFTKRARVIYMIAGIAFIFFALTVLLFHLRVKVGFIDLFTPGSVNDEMYNPYVAVGGWMYILFTASLATAVFYTNRLYRFHEGIIRQRRYPFTIFLVFLIALLIPGLARSGFLRDFPYWIFVFLNVLFAARAYHEYFIYRMCHLNDLHAKLEQSEKSRTEIINSVITSSAEEDHRIINGTLSSFLERTQRSLTVSSLMFNAVMAYRRKGDVLKVDSPEMIINYCAPLTKLEAVKRLGQKELNALIMRQVFPLERIRSTPREGLTEFGELAVKDMIETKDRVIIPIPLQYKGLFKLMVMYPVYNHEELTGFVVMFKPEFDQVFPQEDTIIRSLIGNLSIIFAIMGGKEVQQEKNRLSGEMDIARSIQTSIVPRSIPMPGYETSVSMTTASEVGGDLYDHFPSEFGSYLDIGDVAGHGLPAGMMALIHLSALHGALFTSQVLKKALAISDVYDVINKVLCSINRKRIGSDKFMTCNVLVENNGTFRHAGTHLIALLYRKKGDSVEELRDMIEKTAFLGLSEFVESRQSESGFTMEKGDVLMLYTDGAIEAKNQHDEQYGLERLKGVFKESSGLPTDGIIKAVTESVTAFAEAGDLKKFGGRLADDVSLVVLRRS